MGKLFLCNQQVQYSNVDDAMEYDNTMLFQTLQTEITLWQTVFGPLTEYCRCEYDLGKTLPWIVTMVHVLEAECTGEAGEGCGAAFYWDMGGKGGICKGADGDGDAVYENVYEENVNDSTTPSSSSSSTSALYADAAAIEHEFKTGVVDEEFADAFLYVQTQGYTGSQTLSKF